MKSIEARLEQIEARQRGIEQLLGELRADLTRPEAGELGLPETARRIGYSVHTLRDWLGDAEEFVARRLAELVFKRNGRWRSSPDRVRRWLATTHENCRPVPGRKNGRRVPATKESAVEAVSVCSVRRRDATAPHRSPQNEEAVAGTTAE